jgi:hypothetical protein
MCLPGLIGLWRAAKKLWKDIAHLARPWELLEAVPARLLALSRWSYVEECRPVELPLRRGQREGRDRLLSDRRGARYHGVGVYGTHARREAKHG